MTTLNKIVYDIAHTVGREDDFTFLERLKFKVHQYRATILRRDLDRNKFTPSQYIQTIGGVEMEYVDASSACGIELGCKILRSKKKIPNPVRFKDRVPFYYVGTIDGKKGYSPINPSELSYFGSSKYSSTLPRYFFDGGYLHVLNSNAKQVRLKGVFEYPQELAGFTCDGQACYSDDSPYPITVDLVRDISEAIINGSVVRERPDEDKQDIDIDG